MTLLLTLLAKPFIPGPPPAALTETFDKVCGPAEPAPTHQERELNGDGQREHLLARRQGGSGWSETCTCVQDGASGQISCGTWEETVYASFSGWRPARLPYMPPDYKGARAGPQDCQAPDRDSPAQAGMWLLERPGNAPPAALRWHSGDPVRQAVVCMSVAQARPLGGLSWEPSGEIDDLDSRTVVYTPPSAGVLGAPEDQRIWDQSLDGQTQLLSVGHALLLVQPAAKRHAWLLNTEALVPEHHKVSRWSSIQSAKLEEDRVRVTLVGQSQAALIIPLNQTP